MSTWIKSEWELRDNLPETLDLCVTGKETGMDYVALFHTADCYHLPRSARGPETRYAAGWRNDIPTQLAVEAWPQSTAASRVGYCQHCVIQRKRNRARS